MYIYIFLDEGIAYQQFGGNKSLKICFNDLVHLRLRISSWGSGNTEAFFYHLKGLKKW